MPSGLRKTTGKHFEIYYEQPWGGVASDKDSVDIADNQLVSQDGAVIVDGTLAATILTAPDGTSDGFSFTPVVAGAYIAITFGIAGVLYAMDTKGYFYKLVRVLGPPSHTSFEPVMAGPLYVLPPDAPWTNPPTAVKVINGIAYIANFGNHSTYNFDPAALTSNLLTDYVGGMYMGVLDNYLLQFNTNNIVDGVQRNRVNWSGPNKFGVWDPAIDRTAGFNTLAEIEDELTGFLSYASVGVLLSRKTLIELSPTGVAISPFTFTTLWTSDVGQGCVYPDTISQYGQRGFLVTDSDVYTVSTGAGLTTISGTARAAIFSDIYRGSGTDLTLSTVSGCVMLLYANSTYPTPCYVITIVLTGLLVTWIFDLTTNTWQRSTFSVDPVVFGVTAKSSDTYAPSGSLTAGLYNFPFMVLNAITQAATPGLLTSKLFGISIYKSNVQDTTGVFANTQLRFKTEQLKMYRKPTIRRIVLRAYGSAKLHLDVSGISFGDIQLDGTNTPKTYISSIGLATIEEPQLTVTSDGNPYNIVKIMLAGTYADGEID